MPGALLIILLTLGGLGLYLAMPGGRLHVARAALILAAGAGAALVAVALPVAGKNAEAVWFVILALIGVISGLRVITHSKPVYSALYFVLVIISTAGMMILMQATFLAMALVIIYAGAILVTYAFVIMLAQQGDGLASYDQRAREPFLGVVTGFILLAALTYRISSGQTLASGASSPDIANLYGRIETVGTSLLTNYIVGVEAVGVVLLAAMVGAIAIARRRAIVEPGEVD